MDWRSSRVFSCSSSSVPGKDSGPTVILTMIQMTGKWNEMIIYNDMNWNFLFSQESGV